MPAGASDSGSDQAALLLGDLDRIEPSVSDPLCESSNLAERVTDAVERFGVAVDQELRAVLAPRLLVARERQDEIAGGLEPLPRGTQEGRNEHRDPALHVE